ncbi:MAG: hypothetical protein HPZ89_10585, partial [Oscillospiraceae bacterium]|nr:hypothetical protein [Oscillospiraceae bacterium]
ADQLKHTSEMSCCFLLAPAYRTLPGGVLPELHIYNEGGFFAARRFFSLGFLHKHSALPRVWNSPSSHPNPEFSRFKRSLRIGKSVKKKFHPSDQRRKTDKFGIRAVIRVIATAVNLSILQPVDTDQHFGDIAWNIRTDSYSHSFPPFPASWLYFYKLLSQNGHTIQELYLHNEDFLTKKRLFHGFITETKQNRQKFYPFSLF